MMLVTQCAPPLRQGGQAGFPCCFSRAHVRWRDSGTSWGLTRAALVRKTYLLAVICAQHNCLCRNQLFGWRRFLSLGDICLIVLLNLGVFSEK